MGSRAEEAEWEGIQQSVLLDGVHEGLHEETLIRESAEACYPRCSQATQGVPLSNDARASWLANSDGTRLEGIGGPCGTNERRGAS